MTVINRDTVVVEEKKNASNQVWSLPPTSLILKNKIFKLQVSNILRGPVEQIEFISLDISSKSPSKLNWIEK